MSTLHQHAQTTCVRTDGTTFTCGATGPIEYDNGRAWKVNVYRDGYIERRWILDDFGSNINECAECRRHTELAKKEENK